MSLQIPPATQVLVVVFSAWAAGTAVGAAVTRLGGEVQAGHFKVMWPVTAGIAAVAGLGSTLSFVTAALALLTFLAIYRGKDRETGVLTAGVSLVALAGAAFGVQGGSAGVVAFSLAAAALLGAVTNAMLLGHWHLNQPRLGTGPLRRLVWGSWAGLVAFVVAGVAMLLSGLDHSQDVAILGAVTAVAFALFAAVLTAMVTHLVRTRSIMSATGILYLEVLLCFVAVFSGALGALAPGT